LLVNQALANSLNDLGGAVGKTIREGLKRNGILISNQNISLVSLREVLADLMGDVAAETLLEHIVLELDRLYAEA
jgi:hypothetical protein